MAITYLREGSPKPIFAEDYTPKMLEDPAPGYN